MEEIVLTTPEIATATTVKVSQETKLTLDRLARQLEAGSLGDLVAFLARHFETSGHFARFADLRELQTLSDRLRAVLLFLSTTNLEIGQQLRRIHGGHYRRLAQYADELLALHQRLLARKNPAPNTEHRRSA